VREDDQEEQEPKEPEASVLSEREAMSLISSGADEPQEPEPEPET
jgi:hypothetical protein